MIRRAILLVCAVLAAASSLATCHNPFNVEYLDFNLGNSCSKENIQITKSALESLEPIKEMPKDEKLAALKKNISNMQNKVGLFDPRWSVYQDLLNLFNEQGQPNTDVVKQVMAILCIYKDYTDEKLNWFVSLLQEYGTNKFLYSSLKSIEELSIVSIPEHMTKQEIYEIPILPQNVEAKKRLDQLFRVNSLTEDERLKVLKKIVMRQFDAEKTVREVFNFEGDRAKAVKDFIQYILGLCRSLREGREINFNIFTLAITFGLSDEYGSSHVKELKEYNRLCASIALQETQDAIGEFRKYYEFSILKQTNEAQ